MVGLDVTPTGAPNSEHPGRASPPARSLVLFDAGCGFCKWLLAGLLRWDRAARVRPIALGAPEAEKLLHDLSPDERLASWHLISPGGERRSGGAGNSRPPQNTARRSASRSVLRALSSSHRPWISMGSPTPLPTLQVDPGEDQAACRQKRPAPRGAAAQLKLKMSTTFADVIRSRLRASSSRSASEPQGELGVFGHHLG